MLHRQGIDLADGGSAACFQYAATVYTAGKDIDNLVGQGMYRYSLASSNERAAPLTFD